MVLEQIYKLDWIAYKTRYAFLLGVTYTILGIASALLLFPEDPGIVAIAFTSLILLPSLNQLLALEENREARESKFNIYQLLLEHRDVVKIYLFLFLGIMAVFAFYALVWPNAATSSIFKQQIDVIGTTGNAVSLGVSFMDIFLNNAKVLLIMMVFSFIYGSGSVFILTWNASVWGTILGVIARNSALVSGENSFVYFIITLFAILPHLLAEAIGYFLGTVAGGVISTAVLREKLFSSRFKAIVIDSMIFLVLAILLIMVGAYIEFYITGNVINYLGL